jgi:hypothetical protein
LEMDYVVHLILDLLNKRQTTLELAITSTKIGKTLLYVLWNLFLADYKI